MKSAAAIVVVALALVFAPPLGGSGHAAPALSLRLATMMPARGMLQVKKWAAELDQRSAGRLQVSVVPRGRLGEDREIVQRLRSGAFDGAHLSSITIRKFVRQAMILDAPGLFSNQRQVVAARQALEAEFDREAYANGFKIMGWQDVAPTRIFSKRPVVRPQDLVSMKPWQPDEPIMKELYAMLGVRGVQLPMGQLFRALRADSVDVVYGAAVTAMVLQWHTQTRYVSRQGGGWIQIAFVLNRSAFDAMEPDLQTLFVERTEAFNRKVVLELRRDDRRVLKRFTGRGMRMVDIDEAAWSRVGIRLRERFVGRLYTGDMLERVKRIAAENP